MPFYNYDCYNNFHYTSVEELKLKAQKYVEKEEAKGNKLSPVFLESRVIAKSWWGKAWCSNLELYADYLSRLDRGRKYVRSNCVVDLQIEPGSVRALVQGSTSKPYTVRVRIDELTDEQYKNVISKCSSKIQNLEDLISGNFPDDLKELFTQKKGGLFPSMANIHFDCTCPDVADMCKHVAAVLYAIGSRFDTEPLLFFKLRGVDTDSLIGNAIQDRLDKMIANADVKSSRIISDNEAKALFGV